MGPKAADGPAQPPLDRDRNYVEGLIQLNCSQNLFPPFLNMQIKIKMRLRGRKRERMEGNKLYKHATKKQKYL